MTYRTQVVGLMVKAPNLITDDVEDILKEFRYYAKLDFSLDAHKFKKFKVADAELKLL